MIARPRAFLPYFPLLVALLATLSYWPGLVTYDSVRQYDQALSGLFDDWHPPMMEWVWRQMIPFWPGPAPMLLLQLLLYGAGLAGLIGWAMRRGRARLALAIGCVALMPLSLALMGAVLKDCLMAGALMAASALALAGWRGSGTARVACVLLVLFAATLRFNAFLAGVPILLVALGPAVFATRLRLCIAAIGASAMLLAAMPVANRALHAQSSDVGLSLVIFDLAGITYYSGQDAFPPMEGVADPLAVVRGCYTPVKWDSFSWWVDPLCPIHFEKVRQAMKRGHGGGTVWLAGQVARHPIAYIRHRLGHWNINARFWVHDWVERPVQRVSAPNDWGFRVAARGPIDWVDRAARWSALTPLDWPCVWMALGAGLLLAAQSLSSRVAIRMFAGSSLLYGLGYGVFSVASELRYYLWTMMAGALALVIALADLPRVAPARRGGVLLSIFGPATIVAAAAAMARLF